MSIDQFIKKDLIFLKLSFNTQKELFQFLGEQVYQRGYVTDDFLSRVVDRERNFPTGLKLNHYNVAIPHTDAECVKKQFIAVATLAPPVVFQQMADKTQDVDVSLVFMLGLNEPHFQLEALKELVGMIQNEKHVTQLVNASDKDELFKALTLCASINR
ncbi:PTS sugar transporter subunit IIA [Sporolactobacillus sp. THM19-2]|uniref:PTS sugar transporter subunit IIA n=1 Tax=Sporolactobacillus sp. THM19-2 TaxID=2511171 RepID=UPI0010214D86|nr:PTS sugar transporter subunit IIA [Sporolactobacillus sp. THM19-2]RYL87809.1 PTS sugar transporter subunit IIA [Sporolactobacillus sp. THM19-2]